MDPGVCHHSNGSLWCVTRDKGLWSRVLWQACSSSTWLPGRGPEAGACVCVSYTLEVERGRFKQIIFKGLLLVRGESCQQQKGSKQNEINRTEEILPWGAQVKCSIYQLYTPAHVYLILKCLLMKLISVNTHLLCFMKDNCVVCSAVKLVFFPLCREEKLIYFLNIALRCHYRQHTHDFSPNTCPLLSLGAPANTSWSLFPPQLGEKPVWFRL